MQSPCCWRSIGPFDFSLAESARLMSVTASPLPARAGAIAGLISWNPAAERRGDTRQASGTTAARPCPNRHRCGLRRPAALPTPAGQTEAATADVWLLQPRQRPAADPDTRCANRVVTTRRQPVVTTRMLPQRPRAYCGQPQVTVPRDGLTARQNSRSCNAICPARSPRAMSAMAPPGAPPSLGEWLDPMNRLAAASAIEANAACRGGQQ